MLQTLPIEILCLVAGYLRPIDRKWLRATCKLVRAKMAKPNKVEFKCIMLNNIKYLIDYIRDYIESGDWCSQPDHKAYIDDLITSHAYKSILGPVIITLTKLVKQYNYGDDMTALGLKLLSEQVTNEANNYFAEMNGKIDNLYNRLLQDMEVQDLNDTNPEYQAVMSSMNTYYQAVQAYPKVVWIKKHTVNKQVVLKAVACPKGKEQFYLKFAEPIHTTTSLDLPLDLVSTIHTFMLTNLEFYLNDDIIESIKQREQETEELLLQVRSEMQAIGEAMTEEQAVAFMDMLDQIYTGDEDGME